MKETEAAMAVIEMLTDHEIYQEVKTPWGTTDIVAKCGSILWAIEVKLSLNLVVLGQAWCNTQYFHYSSIAVPKTNRKKGALAADHFCRQNGIGIIYIGNNYLGKPYASENLSAHFHRKAFTKYINLYEEQKTWAMAGNADGRAYTPFMGTKQQLIEYVKKHPGCPVREAMENINHHYHKLSTAMSCIRQWINKGVISELSLQNGGLYIAEGI